MDYVTEYQGLIYKGLFNEFRAYEVHGRSEV